MSTLLGVLWRSHNEPIDKGCGNIVQQHMDLIHEQENLDKNQDNLSATRGEDRYINTTPSTGGDDRNINTSQSLQGEHQPAELCSTPPSSVPTGQLTARSAPRTVNTPTSEGLLQLVSPPDCDTKFWSDAIDTELQEDRERTLSAQRHELPLLRQERRIAAEHSPTHGGENHDKMDMVNRASDEELDFYFGKSIGGDWAWVTKDSSARVLPNNDRAGSTSLRGLWKQARPLRGDKKRGNLPTSSSSNSSEEELRPSRGNKDQDSAKDTANNAAAWTVTSSYEHANAVQTDCYTVKPPTNASDKAGKARASTTTATAAATQPGSSDISCTVPGQPVLPGLPHGYQTATALMKSHALTAESRTFAAPFPAAPSVTLLSGCEKADARVRGSIPGHGTTRLSTTSVPPPITIPEHRGGSSSIFPNTDSSTRALDQHHSAKGDKSTFGSVVTRSTDFSTKLQNGNFSSHSTATTRLPVTTAVCDTLSDVKDEKAQISIFGPVDLRLPDFSAKIQHGNSRRHDNFSSLTTQPAKPLGSTAVNDTPPVVADHDTPISSFGPGPKRLCDFELTREDDNFSSASTPPEGQLLTTGTSEAPHTPAGSEKKTSFSAAVMARSAEKQLSGVPYKISPPDERAYYHVERLTPQAHHQHESSSVSLSSSDISDSDSASSCELNLSSLKKHKPALVAAKAQTFLLDSGASGNYLNADALQAGQYMASTPL